MKRKFDEVPEEISKQAIAEVIARVEEIESEEVGMIAAQDIIDIVINNYGPEIYNIALRDAKKMISEKLSDVEYEIDSLEQS